MSYCWRQNASCKWSLKSNLTEFWIYWKKSLCNDACFYLNCQWLIHDYLLLLSNRLFLIVKLCFKNACLACMHCFFIEQWEMCSMNVIHCYYFCMYYQAVSWIFCWIKNNQKWLMEKKNKSHWKIRTKLRTKQMSWCSD